MGYFRISTGPIIISFYINDLDCGEVGLESVGGGGRGVGWLTRVEKIMDFVWRDGGKQLS